MAKLGPRNRTVFLTSFNRQRWIHDLPCVMQEVLFVFHSLHPRRSNTTECGGHTSLTQEMQECRTVGLEPFTVKQQLDWNRR